MFYVMDWDRVLGKWIPVIAFESGQEAIECVQNWRNETGRTYQVAYVDDDESILYYTILGSRDRDPYLQDTQVNWRRLGF
jgi:hypothetical protein